MSKQEIKSFFSKIASDKALQEQLYVTKEIHDVAIIAKSLGFKVTGADILRSQAGRILLLSPQEVEDIAAGKKGKTGAQWGREGKGYLDSAGYWVNKFIEWDCADPAFEKDLEAFLTKIKEDPKIRSEVILAKTHHDVTAIAAKHNYIFSGSSLLKYQAIQILKLSDEKAEQVAKGA